ncbi:MULTISPECIES: PAS domain S-box protein [Hydrogenophaga]|uniref:PAS domain-containing sensor histidine kinase n=1 Tax=Hydrogenophaga TaxID=47420 RepID=UPI001CFB8D37|nr:MULTISPECIES: PAS domain S-box protein [Hydrogenophaga]MDO9032642.1 PAS domain S-box protein [Hydrogenophaga sp.]UCU95453.1 PAS domain S-box protein [Hydrogenophaga taeniospiralis]
MDITVGLDPNDLANPELERLVAQRTQELERALARAQSLYEEAPSGHLSLDAELRLVNINQTLLNWLGYAREEVINELDLFALIDPSWRGLLQTRMESLRQSGRTLPMEIEVQRKDGTRFHALFSSTAVNDEHGAFLYTNTTVLDISDRKAAEQRVAAHDGFLQTITDRIPVRLAYYDKDLICRFSNSAHARRYGKMPSELVGTHLSQVVRAELMPEILPHFAEALSGQPQNFEAERQAHDGTTSFYEIHYIPDFQHGMVEGIFIEMHDISERRRIEEFVLEANRDLEERVRERSAELFQSEQRYRLMVDAIQDHCIYFVDENGAVTEWTESAQRLHGHSRAQMLGEPYTKLLATDNAGEDEVNPEQVLRLAKSHGQWETRGWRLRDDGSRFWAHTVLTALRNEAGELQGLSSITRDMTAAKSLEDVMNDLNRELEKRVAERTQQLVAANKDLDVFSHMVSHDLRAPLRHIASFVSLLQEQMGESSDSLALQYLNSIAKASKRMSIMIEGLLEYARLGRVTIEAQPVPLAPLLDGVIAHLKQENPHRSIEWVVEEDLPVVRGDAMLLAEVFSNMLNNSVKYTRTREHARIEIGWKVNPVGGRTFFIHDNGVGFDLEKAHNLFVMFQRQHHSMDFEGNGTGLALSQRIIERHAGRIWAETAPGEGCTFYFTLPFEGLEHELDFPKSSLAELAI